MKVETFLGALVAALIGFGTAFLALLGQDGVDGVADISEVSWWTIVGGAFLAFLKDVQALWTRQQIGNVTGNGYTVKSPWLVGGLAVLILLFAQGCSTVNLANSIGFAQVSIETMAETIQQECGNAEPGGDCLPTSLLDRGDVDSMKVDLQLAKDAVDDANRVYNAGDAAGAADHLQAAQAILATLRTALEVRGVQ